jgi:hypothetical protein
MGLHAAGREPSHTTALEVFALDDIVGYRPNL